MKTIVCTTALLIGLVSLGNSQDKLPRQTESLLEKLEEWKAKEIAEFDKNVQAKRRQVAVALKSHLKKATQAGDLKTANLIQAEIDELTSSATGAITAKIPKIKNKPRTEIEIKELLIGRKWKHHEGNKSFPMIVFYGDNTLGFFEEANGSEEPAYRPQTRIENHVMQYYNTPLAKWTDIEISKSGREIVISIGNKEPTSIVTYRK